MKPFSSDLPRSDCHDAAAPDHIEATHTGRLQARDRVYVHTNFKYCVNYQKIIIFINYTRVIRAPLSRRAGPEDQGENGGGQEENQSGDHRAERQVEGEQGEHQLPQDGDQETGGRRRPQGALTDGHT